MGWCVSYVADAKDVKEAMKKQPNKGGIYFPIAAVQVIWTAMQQWGAREACLGQVFALLPLVGTSFQPCRACACTLCCWQLQTTAGEDFTAMQLAPMNILHALTSHHCLTMMYMTAEI